MLRRNNIVYTREPISRWTTMCSAEALTQFGGPKLRFWYHLNKINIFLLYYTLATHLPDIIWSCLYLKRILCESSTAANSDAEFIHPVAVSGLFELVFTCLATFVLYKCDEHSSCSIVPSITMAAFIMSHPCPGALLTSPAGHLKPAQ